MSKFLAILPRLPAPLRILIFLIGLSLIWLPLALPLYGIFGNNPNLVSILTMLLLYSEFLLLLQLWGRWLYRYKHVIQHYGLEWSNRNGLRVLQGFAIGGFGLFSLFLLEGALGWLQWQGNFLVGHPTIILEGLAVALGIGVAEELFFRGWLLDELERDYSPLVALWLNSTLFAVLHFIKPISEIQRTWPQFAGLLLLGAILVTAKRQGQIVKGRWAKPVGGRLGLSIGLHAGLVWGYYLINVGQMAIYTGRVPAWVTGIDKNPLAGLMGLLFLGLIGVVIYNFEALAYLISLRLSKTRH